MDAGSPYSFPLLIPPPSLRLSLPHTLLPPALLPSSLPHSFPPLSHTPSLPLSLPHSFPPPPSHLSSRRSTFACNRVRTHTLTKWVVKEFDNVLVPESEHGLFYCQEAYVIRWAYIITVVRELEGLTPGYGPFAQDRKYRKRLEVSSYCVYVYVPPGAHEPLRWRKGASNCMEHHFSHVDQPMSKFGMHCYSMGGLYAHAKYSNFRMYNGPPIPWKCIPNKSLCEFELG